MGMRAVMGLLLPTLLIPRVGVAATQRPVADPGCQWTQCSSRAGCPRGLVEVESVECNSASFFFGGKRRERHCCDRSQQALLRWRDGAAQADAGAEDACFNRCPVQSTCNAATLRCECVDGYTWVGSEDARTGLCVMDVSGQNLRAKSTGDAGSSVRRRRWWWRPWAEPDPDEGELSVTHPQHHWMLSGLLAASALQVGLVVYVAAAYWLSRRAVGAR